MIFFLLLVSFGISFELIYTGKDVEGVSNVGSGVAFACVENEGMMELDVVDGKSSWTELSPNRMCDGELTVSPDRKMAILAPSSDYFYRWIIPTNEWIYNDFNSRDDIKCVNNGICVALSGKPGPITKGEEYDIGRTSWPYVAMAKYRDYAISSDGKIIVGIEDYDNSLDLIGENNLFESLPYNQNFNRELRSPSLAIHEGKYYLYVLRKGIDGLDEVWQMDISLKEWSQIEVTGAADLRYSLEDIQVSDDGFVVIRGETTGNGKFKLYTSQLAAGTMKECSNYEGGYKQGEKQCGFDKEHFKSSDEESETSIQSIDFILESLETGFENEGTTWEDELTTSFNSKRYSYEDVTDAEKAYTTALENRNSAESNYDEKREKEELAHQNLITKIGEYNQAVIDYREKHSLYLEKIDFLNYELYIIQQIRELLGLRIGYIPEQIILEKSEYDGRFESWVSSYPKIRTSTFSHEDQRFDGTNTYIRSRWRQPRPKVFERKKKFLFT